MPQNTLTRFAMTMLLGYATFGAAAEGVVLNNYVTRSIFEGKRKVERGEDEAQKHKKDQKGVLVHICKFYCIFSS